MHVLNQAKSDRWYLWCVVHGMACKAAAPTGIAAANIEIESTDICAATLHSVFDLDAEYQSSLDFSKPGLDKVSAILKMKARRVVRKLMSCSVPTRQCAVLESCVWSS